MRFEFRFYILTNYFHRCACANEVDLRLTFGEPYRGSGKRHAAAAMTETLASERKYRPLSGSATLISRFGREIPRTEFMKHELTADFG